MSLYAKVENGKVLSVGKLPANYKNVSGFNKLSAEKVKPYGFLPYQLTPTNINTNTHKMGQLQYEVGKSSVTGSYASVQLSAEELNTKKSNVCAQIKKLLNECLYNTDWVELPNNGLTSAQLTRYRAYRAKMKDAKAGLDQLNLNDLNSLLETLTSCQNCMHSRLDEFSEHMESFEHALTVV